ncbi:hypothetical protein ACGF3G_00665 [Streptomyces sp. NPDC048179]|uniref:hypothetical protein n=1 Tax=Streptomyces sp. NPDC048179 TaxID=3365506 RepID=UPI0037126178
MHNMTQALRDGGQVELPAGMTPCRRPLRVLYSGEEGGRVRGYTPAGASIYTAWSCPAYARAAEIAGERVLIARLRDRAGQFDAARVPAAAAKLRALADRQAAALALTLAAYADDPAPCTCPTD